MDVATQSQWYRRRSFRWLMAGGSVVVVAIVAMFMIYRSSEPTLTADQVVVATVKKSEGALELRAAGELARQRRIAIQAPADGVVKRIDVEPGAAVSSGTALAVLSNVDLELAARTALAELEVTQAELASEDARLVGQVEAQKMELARSVAELELSATRARGHQKLFEAGMISEMALTEYKSAHDLAKLKVDIESRKLTAVETEYAVHRRSGETRIAIARSESHRAAERVKEMTITAPFGGIAERYAFAVGETVAKGEEVVSFAGTGGMDAVVRVLERSAQRVRPGAQAMLSVGRQQVPAEVQRMDPRVEDGVVRVTLRPKAEFPDSWLPGQRVDSLIKIGGPEMGLVLRRPVGVVDDSTAVVLKQSADGRTAVGTSVAFGVGSDGEIEVKEGLAAGDRVVVSDVGRIRVGQVFRLR